MQQTLFALAAILAFSFYALGRHQTDAEVEHDAIAMEIETAVTNVARAHLLDAMRLAFDEQDVGRAGIRTTEPTSTPGPDPGEPGGSPTGTAAYDDVDDYHGWTATVRVPVGSDSVSVSVTGTAVYVYSGDPSGSPATSPTLAKRIAFAAVEVPERPLQGRTPRQAALTRVVTPTSR